MHENVPGFDWPVVLGENSPSYKNYPIQVRCSDSGFDQIGRVRQYLWQLCRTSASLKYDVYDVYEKLVSTHMQCPQSGISDLFVAPQDEVLSEAAGVCRMRRQLFDPTDLSCTLKPN